MCERAARRCRVDNRSLARAACQGAGALLLDTMDEYAGELAEVGRMLRDGTFQLWSCETAHGKRSSDFVDALTHGTGARVAASTQLVGAAANDAAGALRATRH
jgi:Domain of unknown function (DUF4347)